MDNDCEQFFEKARNLHLNAMEEEKCQKCLFSEIQEKPVRRSVATCLNESMTTPDPLFIERARTLHITQEESTRVEGALFAFMQKNPVNMQKALLKKERKSRSAGGFLAVLFSLRYRPILAAVLLLVLGTGSLSYAAESALPGDPLYAIKIHVNEAVQAQLAVTSEAKAEITAVHAAKRMQEAEQLAAVGRLTPALSTQLTTDFNAGVEESRINVQKIAASGDRNRASALNAKTEAKLRGHIAALVALNEKTKRDETTQKNIAQLLQTVERATDQTIAMNASINGQIALETTPAAQMMRVQQDAKISDSEHSTAGMAALDHKENKAFIPAKPPHMAKTSEEKNEPKQEAHREDGQIMMQSETSLPTPPKVMLFLKTRTETGATSSSGTGSAPSKKNGTTPVKIEIREDGKLDVHIVDDATGSVAEPQ